MFQFSLNAKIFGDLTFTFSPHYVSVVLKILQIVD